MSDRRRAVECKRRLHIHILNSSQPNLFLCFFVCVCAFTKILTSVEQLKSNNDVASTYSTVHSQIVFFVVFFVCVCVCTKCLTGVEQLKTNDDIASTYSRVHSQICFCDFLFLYVRVQND